MALHGNTVKEGTAALWCWYCGWAPCWSLTASLSKSTFLQIAVYVCELVATHL